MFKKIKPVDRRVFSLLFFLLAFFPHLGFSGFPSDNPITIKSTKGVEFAKDSILVKFKKESKSNSNAISVESTLSSLNLSIAKEYRYAGGITLLQVNDTGRSITETIEALNKQLGDLIEYVEPNYTISIDKGSEGITATPNDPRFSQLWGMNNTGQTGGTADADIDAAEAWNSFTGDSNLVVAVVDTGIDYTHEDLAANMWINPGEIAGNNIDDDNNGYVDDIYGIDTVNNDTDPMDDNNHGTHVAGTIGAVGNNNIGVAGVNWNIKMMALKFLSGSGSGSTSGAIAALDYILMMKTEKNINIIASNNSWGGGGFSQALYDAISAAGDAGMLFAAAAGNSSCDNDGASPHYPSSYDLANIIAVASTTHTDALSSFSCYGRTSVDIGAPGSAIVSTVPNNGYASFNGTSMATPHVAGAIAFLKGANPSLGIYDIKSTLLSTVDSTAALQGKVLSNGRLNLNRALGCDSSAVDFNPLLEDGFQRSLGESVALQVSISACTPVTGATVTVDFNSGEPQLVLLDNGVAPDTSANDGVYSVNWVPSVVSNNITLTFTGVENGRTHTESVSGEIVDRVHYNMADDVEFNWIDISSTGTDIGAGDDTYFHPVNFDFEFYGQQHSQVAIGSNGVIYFDNDYLGFVNAPIPSQNNYTPQHFIAPFWDDLDVGNRTTSQVFYEVQGTAPNRKLIVQYNDVEHYPSTSSGATFEVILDEATGDILMQYLDVDFNNASYDYAASATIGLQNTPTHGQQYSYNSIVPNVTSLTPGPSKVGNVVGLDTLVKPLVQNNQAILWSLGDIQDTPPGSVNLIAPNTSISDNTPEYLWTADSLATDYLLWVNDATGNVIQQWFSAAEVGCDSAGGSTQCAVTPTTSLANGNAQWWVRASNDAGVGPWGAGLNFVVDNASPPEQPTLVSPDGDVDNNQPSFVWNAVNTATWYQIWITDSLGQITHRKWYRASATGCVSGSGTCTVSTGLTFSGAYTWWVRAYNRYGSGTWSSSMEFVVAASLSAPVLISPDNNITDTTPTFTWNASASGDATWYRLEVSGPSPIAKWVRATNAGCGAGTGICTYTPTSSLAAGNYTWIVKGWNSAAGTGDASVPMSFVLDTADAPTAPVLLSPDGNIADTTPTFTWNASASGDATWYRLEVSGPSPIAKWVRATNAGCGAGTGTCTYTPTSPLSTGNYTWIVKGWNSPTGTGDESTPMSFSL